MKNKIFITGSTDGIGKLAALKLAKQGHELILHGRNPQKVEAVIRELKVASGNDHISGYVADFSDLDAVRTMAEKVKTDHPSIDVLINNAGVFLAASPRNEKGMDIRFVVNYLAPVLLTNELISVLDLGPAPRVINLSSAAQAPVSLEALKGLHTVNDQAAYAQSKLALTMWNYNQARSNQDIIFIAVNPGSLLDTKMVKEAYGKHWAPADKGADILVDLATSDKHASMTGKYFDNDQGSYGRANGDAYDQAKIDALMAVTDQLLK